jgi:hypothetical protein
MRNSKQNKRLKKDLIIILISMVVGIFFLKTGIIKDLLYQSVQLEYLGIFLAGIFFTSAFTTIPATIVLGEMALVVNLPMVALLGGLGALLGDFIIFSFVKDHIAKDLESLFKLRKTSRWKHIFKSHIFKIFLPLIAGIIIASPLPDELGLALLGISKTKNWYFILISFVCNSAGILAIGLIARSIN